MQMHTNKETITVLTETDIVAQGNYNSSVLLSRRHPSRSAAVPVDVLVARETRCRSTAGSGQDTSQSPGASLPSSPPSWGSRDPRTDAFHAPSTTHLLKKEKKHTHTHKLTSTRTFQDTREMQARRGKAAATPVCPFHAQRRYVERDPFSGG